MSEIYHWFLTSGISKISVLWGYISEHAQKPLEVVSSAMNMQPICDGWFLTYKRVEHEREAKRGAAKACKGSNNKR